jgi:hypothetical protein
MRRECTRAVVIQGDSFAAAEAAADGFALHRKISNRVVKLTAFSAVPVIDARNMLVLCRISLTRLSSRHLLNALCHCVGGYITRRARRIRSVASVGYGGPNLRPLIR